jgi:dinuclear metal center YbgI/SA1388 family protein
MKLKEISNWLNSEVPLSYQESYDNSGIQTGEPDMEIVKILLSFDVTEAVIDEALRSGCNLVITHHPLIFSPLKRITGSNYVEKTLLKAIRNNIAVYSCHTNLDSFGGGVSRKMAEKIGLKNVRVLSPLKGHLLKLVTFIPEDHFESVRKAVFEAGAGFIGKYDECSFSVSGKGSFRAGPGAKPFTGEPGKLHFENEIRFETIMSLHNKDNVIKALIEAHPYEEVAYDIYSLVNDYETAGLGCVGDLEEEKGEIEFLEYLRSIFSAEGIRYSSLTGRKVRKVAVCGGAGISLLKEALNFRADAFVTSDIKYHDFFGAESKILLADIGHFESEKFSMGILYDLIIKKFPTFAVRFSETNTNPINYL